MKYSKHYIVLIALLLSFPQKNSFAQNEGFFFGPIVGAKIGYFSPAISSFDDVYDKTSPSIGVHLGLGSGKFYFVGKYRTFSASGKSIVENSTAEGKANWDQNFIQFGLRIYGTEKGNFSGYFEGGIAYGEAEEKISTVDPFLGDLSSASKKSNWGFGGALGLNLRSAPFFSFNAELEYTRIMIDATEGLEEDDINIGGFYFSVGITIHPFK